MNEWQKVEVSFSRIAIPGRGPDAWQVKFRTEAIGHDGRGRLTMGGGGATLREAFERAFVNAAIVRLDPA